MTYENIHNNILRGRGPISLRRSNRYWRFLLFAFLSMTLPIFLTSNIANKNYDEKFPEVMNENLNIDLMKITITSTLESEDIREDGFLEFEGTSEDGTLEAEEKDSNSTLESSSACLLVSDDNHFLIEWIAYHYHVINLRHLIIATDPSSQTSPNNILKRWQGKIEIELWNDTKVLDGINIKLYTNGVTGNKFGLYRLRQSNFYTKCLRHLKRLEKGWVLISDTDEFISINPVLNADDDDKKYSIKEPGSVMAFLQNLTLPTETPEFNTICIPIYRKQYSAQESIIEDVDVRGPSKCNASNFATLRWQKWITKKDTFYSATGKTCSFPRIAGPAKTIINLARLRYNDLFHKDIKGNPHRPLENICSIEGAWITSTEAKIFIHHYLGTLEQWMYRSADSRGAAYRWARYEIMNNAQNIAKSDTVSPWLKGFIESVGDADASYLLKGVGELQPLPNSNDSNMTLADPEPKAENYKVGELVQVYADLYGKSNKQWYWGQVREASKYYNIVSLDNCREILGVSTNQLRRNGTVYGEDLSFLLASVTIANTEGTDSKKLGSTWWSYEALEGNNLPNLNFRSSDDHDNQMTDKEEYDDDNAEYERFINTVL